MSTKAGVAFTGGEVVVDGETIRTLGEAEETESGERDDRWIAKAGPSGAEEFRRGLLLGAAAVAVAFLYSDREMEATVRARNRSVGA